MVAQGMTFHARFWAKVDKRGPNECWPWLGWRKPKGYGRFYLGGRDQPAHRVSLEIAGVSIPDGHEPDHLCEHTWCVNPAHIEVVTTRENILRQKTRERARAVILDAPMVSNAKLTAVQVRKIRADPLSTPKLAKKLGLSFYLIRRVRRRECYMHIL